MGVAKLFRVLQHPHFAELRLTGKYPDKRGDFFFRNRSYAEKTPWKWQQMRFQYIVSYKHFSGDTVDYV